MLVFFLSGHLRQVLLYLDQMAMSEANRSGSTVFSKKSRTLVYNWIHIKWIKISEDPDQLVCTNYLQRQ